MIPFDLLACFGEPVSNYLNAAQEGAKGFKISICKIFDGFRFAISKIRSFLTWKLGSKFARRATRILALGIAVVAVWFSCLVPAAVWPIVGLAVAIIIVFSLITFICRKLRKAATNPDLLQTSKFKIPENWEEYWAQQELLRKDKLVKETQEILDNTEVNNNREVRRKLKKPLREKIKDFIRDRIRSLTKNLDEILSSKYKIPLPTCVTQPSISFQPALSCNIKTAAVKLSNYFSELFDTHNYRKWIDLVFLDKDNYQIADAGVKNAADLICLELYHIDADTFFTFATPEEISQFQYLVPRVWSVFSGDYMHPELLAKIVIGTRLDILSESDIELQTVLSEIKKHDLTGFSELFDNSVESNRILEELFVNDRRSIDWINEIRNSLREDLKTKMNYINADVPDNLKALNRDLTNKESFTYTKWMMKQAGFSKVNIDLNHEWEPYLKAYRKLHFDINSDPRIKYYNEFVNNPAYSDVSYLTCLDDIEESSIYKSANGIDDAHILAFTEAETGERKYLAVITEYNGGGSPITEKVSKRSKSVKLAE